MEIRFTPEVEDARALARVQSRARSRLPGVEHRSGILALASLGVALVALLPFAVGPTGALERN